MKRNQFGPIGLPVPVRLRILRLTLQGVEARTIARRLGIHYNTVSNWRRRLNWSRKCTACGRETRGLYFTCYVCRGIPDTRGRRRYCPICDRVKCGRHDLRRLGADISRKRKKWTAA